MILAGVVRRRANIKATHPGVSRAIPEQTEIGSIPWQRTGQRERGRQKLACQINCRAAGTNRQVKPVQVGPIDRKGQPTPIGTTKDRRVQYIDRLVVDSVQVRTSEIKARIGDDGDSATYWITLHQIRELTLMIENKLGAQKGRD